MSALTRMHGALLGHPLVVPIATRIPVLMRADRLHEAALEAFGATRYARAERLFELAAQACRRDLEVERLARIRVHQQMSRVCAGDSDPGLRAEIERCALRLADLESIHPPHDRVEPHALLVEWQSVLGEEPPAHPPRLRLVS